MNAATVFGDGAVRKDIPGALRVVLGLLVLLVAFSRNYLGVHTPQDVLVGIAPGTFVSCYLQMFYVSFIFPWMIKHFEKT